MLENTYILYIFFLINTEIECFFNFSYISIVKLDK